MVLRPVLGESPCLSTGVDGLIWPEQAETVRSVKIASSTARAKRRIALLAGIYGVATRGYIDQKWLHRGYMAQKSKKASLRKLA